MPYRIADRRLTVRITADRSRYAPGETATVTVRTLDPSGRPVAASVFLQAVDEKLFATGDAAVIDPLDMLYASVGSGVLATVRSHQTPGDDHYGEGGDTTGGGGDEGPRGDFRDWLLGRLVEPTPVAGPRSMSRCPTTSPRGTSAPRASTGRSARGPGELIVPVGLPVLRRGHDPGDVRRRGRARDPGPCLRRRPAGRRRRVVHGRVDDARHGARHRDRHRIRGGRGAARRAQRRVHT